MADAMERVRRRAVDAYGDPELADAVMAHARELGTVELIDTGERTLPHPRDARVWHDRITGRTALSPEQREQQKNIDQRMKALDEKERRLDRLLTRAAELLGPDDAAHAIEEKEGA